MSTGIKVYLNKDRGEGGGGKLALSIIHNMHTLKKTCKAAIYVYRKMAQI